MPETGTPRARQRKRSDYYKWAVGVAVPIIVAVIGVIKLNSGGGEKTPGNFTYIGSVSVIEQEIQQFLGGPIKDDAVKTQVQAAVNLAEAGQFEASRRMFEQLATTLPVPAILTSAGSLNAEHGNAQAARKYFEEALAKKPDYRAALDNLTALKTVKVEEKPLARGREVEPNSDIPHANVLALDSAAAGEISEPSDTDYYRFTTGHPPRDFYRISFKNLSTTLAPMIFLFDGQKNQTTYQYRDTPGAEFDYDFVPDPDTAGYVQVAQRGNTSGAYSLTITPLHKYDQFEPNNDVASAKPIALGRAIEANIMDIRDADFYLIKSAGTGTSTLSLKNTSTTLAPSISIYDGQKNQTTYQYRDTQGADLEYSFPTPATGAYYVQVHQRGNTAGTYSLTAK